MISTIFSLPRILSELFTALLKWTLNLFDVNPGFLDSTRYKDSVEFFFADALVIFLMITVITFIVSVIRSFFPPERTAKFLSEGRITRGFMGNILAALLGVATPLYSNAAGTIPIVSELTKLGVPIGTALAFMMSIIGLSLPELIILRKVMKLKLIGVFVGIMAVAITLTGYLFNAILG